jgi:hypothetical protein
VSQIFNQTFYGSNTSVAMAGRDVSQAVSIKTVDLRALDTALKALGVPSDESAQLASAIEADEEARASRPGPGTQRWLDRLEARAVPVATGVATSTVTAVVLDALGLS